jgi:hypothetical protein
MDEYHDEDEGQWQAYQEEMNRVKAFNNALGIAHQNALLPICRTFGFGATMQEVAHLYKIEVNKPYKLAAPGSNFVVGPCESMTVPCDCDAPHECDWCCGCGWLTKHVKAIKDAE